MILITGGAGFIGSNLAISLLEKGVSDIAICDHFDHGLKWKNLRKHAIADVVHPEHLFDYLEKYKAEIELIYHLGGISSTASTDVDLLIKQNFVMSCRIWDWCAENEVRLIYGSSSATYGDGSNGFKDDDSIAALSKLQPLNAYGWSKHLFDIKVAKRVAAGKPKPPQCVGFKLFNVFGPNEYHKENQQSVLAQMFPRASKNLRVSLFRSHRPDYKDGEQKRDFIYVNDCCDMLMWFYENKHLNGIHNIGSGQAHTFNFLTECLFKALRSPSKQVEYTDMPPELVDKYQYYIEADTSKLRATGYNKPITSLEDGVRDYVQTYLLREDPYR